MNAMTELEPLSKCNVNESGVISLRGSLAGKYYDLLAENRDVFILGLLDTELEGVVWKVEAGQVLIGLREEVGTYFPDW